MLGEALRSRDPFGPVLVHELDDHHRRSIALARAELVDAHIAALAVFKPLGNLAEEPAQNLRVLHVTGRQPPRIEVAAPGQRDQLLRLGPDGFGPGLGGADFIVSQKFLRQIAKQGFALARIATEFSTCYSMSHF